MQLKGAKGAYRILARVNGRAVAFPSIMARDAAALTYPELDIVRITLTDLWAGDDRVTWHHYRKHVGYLPHRPIKLPVLPQPTDDTTLVVTMESAVKLLGYRASSVSRLINQRKLPGAFKADDGMWRVPIKELLAYKEKPPSPRSRYESRFGVVWAPTQTRAGLAGNNDGLIARKLEKRPR